MRLRTLLRGLAQPPKEAAASALVREHFGDLWGTHAALLASGTKAPLVVAADPSCDFGRAVCAANGIPDPDRVCVFGATEEKFLASLSRSANEVILSLRRGLTALPPASPTCMRVVVITGGDMIVLHYLHTTEPAAAAA